MIETLEELHSLLRQLEPSLETALSASVRPVVGITPDRSDVVSKGCSKFGGIPDLPPDVAWPLSGNRKPRKRGVNYLPYQYVAGPLRFVAQVNLSEIDTELWGPAGPRTGLLSFFAACHKHDLPFSECEPCDWKVIHTPDIECTIPRVPPQPSAEFVEALDESDAPVENGSMLFPESAIRFKAGFMAQNALTPERVQALEASLRDSQSRLLSEIFIRRPEHLLGGHPNFIHSPAEGWAAAFANCAPSDMVMLAQFDCDTRTGIDWAGGGRGHFMIHRDALQRLAFDEAVLVSQQT